MKKIRIVVFTGSGVSAPSGLATFRDTNGIWARYTIEEVATPQAWEANPEKVCTFYNERRLQLGTVKPNAGHWALAGLEDFFDVQIITQNVDDLHERAGSSTVLHLHGELTKVRSDRNPDWITDIGYTAVSMEDQCPEGGRLRPHVVWFGEPILFFDEALHHFRTCDIVIVVGTSLSVYPAAGLIRQAPDQARRYLVDPDEIQVAKSFIHLKGSAERKLPRLCEKLKKEARASGCTAGTT
ncbi:MAG: NAD-dependent protein deacylase [Desulfobacterales bacterium]|nr:MAG: NAD-dependent protein deacylase [Desulfobacterales bacterium]